MSNPTTPAEPGPLGPGTHGPGTHGSGTHGPECVFAALGDVTRLDLVERLSDGRPRSIVQLTGGSGLSRQGVTKHLRVLERAGLVGCEKVGRERRFVLRPEPLAVARSYLDRVGREWDEALGRLRAFVESEPKSRRS